MLQHPEHRRGARRRARPSARGTCRPTVVLSPALGGIVIGQEVGARARRPRDLRRAPGRRADAAPRLLAGARRSRVVVEDVDHHRRLDARDDRRGATPPARTVVGAGAIIDRSGGRARRSACRSQRWSRSRCRPTSPTPARCAPKGDAGQSKPGRASTRDGHLTYMETRAAERRHQTAAIAETSRS